ncbi:hypothetical protein MMOR_09840 [Mycolicibacterium moriokaense]|uniref:Mce/MlaD domain-containing protein n=2 Tax=Mycolicibacterium moriokaense TaxID=39691 RepID=A0AAD1M4F9_9MYCO|nr:hypothetical protein MMOR_09840 [Mycolicibacterium moriokaense]
MIVRMVRRAARVAVTLLVSAGVVVVASSCGAVGAGQRIAYCAIMPDSVGLYVGNPVTQMGFQIGEVTSIVPSPTSVRVDFLVGDRSLPSDVKAVIRSTSILADRSLELVGNYGGGPQLEADTCIPLNRSATPKTLSEVIGSATTFLNAINPADSTNIGGTVAGIDELARDNGARMNQLLVRSSSLLDSPDRAISDIGSIVDNLAELTTTVSEVRGPIKQALLDARMTMPDLQTAVEGAALLANNLAPFLKALADIENNLGDETQITLDSVSAAMRKATPHANAFADLLNPVPWWINNLANHFNGRQFNIAYRPPLYRIPERNGLALCGLMNAQVPGSCADVHGQPYAVDVALLQFVLMQASQR